MYKNNFPVWKTLKLGIHKTTSEIRKDLRAGKFWIGWTADSELNNITINKQVDVCLVTATTKDLGLKRYYGNIEGAYYDEIVDRIKELGFDLCPAEVGPQLRLQYRNQPKDEKICVTSDTDKLFIVGHDSLYGRYLFVSYTYSNYGPNFFCADDRWMFMCRKQSTLIWQD